MKTLILASNLITKSLTTSFIMLNTMMINETKVLVIIRSFSRDHGNKSWYIPQDVKKEINMLAKLLFLFKLSD